MDGTFIYSFIIETSIFFCNFGCDFDFSTWNIVIKNAFMYKKFFDSNLKSWKLENLKT